MPFVRVTSFPQTQEAKAEIAKGITEVVHKATKNPARVYLGGFDRCRRRAGLLEEPSYPKEIKRGNLVAGMPVSVKMENLNG